MCRITSRALLLAAGILILVPSAAPAGLPARPARVLGDPRRAAPFAPTLLPSTSGSPVDCVILAPDSLADLFQRLADFQTRSGRPTVVRALSTLRSARDLWGIRWAVLGGDHETIPLRVVHVTYGEPQDIPSDAYYADLDGTWDTNGNGIYGEVADSLDMQPDIAVGRLSAASRTDAQVLVSKALRYATNPLAAAISRHLILAEVLVPNSWQPGQLISVDGAVDGESLKVRVPACATVDRYYENASAYPGALQLTKAAALAALGRGYGIVTHIGHGARSQLSIGSEVVTMPDLATLANGDSLGLWIASNCAS